MKGVDWMKLPSASGVANWPLWYAALSFQHTRRFGMLFLLGLILDVIARGIGLVG